MFTATHSPWSGNITTGAFGVAGSLASFRVLKSMLYDTGGTDPLVMVATAVAMGVLVGAACLVPARAAMSVDPLTILRDE